MKFFIVDAFTEEIFGGNPAGIVLIDEGKDFPSKELMIKTAKELRYSETAFVKRVDENTFHTRYFTPADEVDLCGHATIGSFGALATAGLIKDDHDYINKTLAGELEVKNSGKYILMEMGSPKYISTIKDPVDLDKLYRVMGILKEDVLVQTGCQEYLRINPMIISTGLPDIILPVKTRETLDDINPDFKELAKLSKEYGVVGVHAFALDKTGENTCYCRNFAPLYEIDEEAATGTSNGALSFYLYGYGFVEDNQELTFVQGEKMGRPSKILAHITKLDDSDKLNVKIQVGGAYKVLAEGEINL